MDFQVSVPVPLFGSLNPGGVQCAAAAQRRAAAREEAAEIVVGVELQRAIRAVEINAERVRYIEEEYVVRAEEARDMVRARTNLGRRWAEPGCGEGGPRDPSSCHLIFRSHCSDSACGVN